MTYSQAIEFLDGLVNYEKLAGPRNEFKLDNIRRLLELAGNPERRMRNVILVAGTKGKGSVCYMLDAALRGCRLSTGMFVSPHVLDVRERIQLGGKPIPKSLFANFVARLAPFVSCPRPASRAPRPDRVAVSYFEMTTAMAFLLFAEKQPDYSIIEVGLGGRLDATNLADPAVSVITRIGYDHVKVLGSTLTKIAGEKAGIMRKGRPVVIGDQEPEALAALKRKARAAGACLIRAPSVASVPSVQSSAAGLSFRVRSRLGAGIIRLPLLGLHQAENCQTALAVLNELSMGDGRIKFKRVARGMATVSIPARCQVVRRRPLTIVDSCHNPESGRALANVLRDHLPLLRSAPRPAPRTPRPLPKVILVYGSLSGKLVEETVAPLAPFVQQAVLVRPDSPRAIPLAELGRIFSRVRIPHTTADSVPVALARAKTLAQAQAQAAAPPTHVSVPARHSSCGVGRSGPCRTVRTSSFPIVVAGSFYLAGEVLKVLGPSRARQWLGRR
jgi:dihydrofolate synthase/folylpolyglutamate synthase